MNSGRGPGSRPGAVLPAPAEPAVPVALAREPAEVLVGCSLSGAAERQPPRAHKPYRTTSGRDGGTSVGFVGAATPAAGGPGGLDDGRGGRDGPSRVPRSNP